jgi:uncharacterized protein YjbI with pentapeptide repeats
VDGDLLRWSGKAGTRLRDEVVARLRAGRPLTGLGLGEVDGRVDLRGLRLEARTRLDDVTLEGLDLRRAVLDHVALMRCAIRDCRFDHASCQQVKAWACDVTDCSFAGADLFAAMLEGWHDGRANRFTGVSFVDANLRRGVGGGQYVDCDFSGARVANRTFDGVTFVRCTFAGPLYKATIRPRAVYGFIVRPGDIVETDFSRVLFWRTTLTGVEFGEVALPADPDLVVIPDAARASAARAALPGTDAAVWPAQWLGSIEGSLESTGGGALFNFRDEPHNVGVYRRALRAAGVTVAPNAGRGLVGRSASYLRSLGMTLDRAYDLRSYLEEDREREYVFADRLDVPRAEVDAIPSRYASPLEVADYIIRTLGG